MVETVESKEVGEGVPEDVKKMDVDLEVTNKDFEEVKDEEGKVLFSCVHCPYKNPTIANTKKHITACHVKPKTAKRSTTDTGDHDVKRKKDKKSVPDDENEDGDAEVFPATQEDEDEMFRELEALIDSTKEDEKEESIIVFNSTVVETGEDSELEEKNKVILNLQAIINQLEEEKRTDREKNERYKGTFQSLKETIETQKKEKKGLQDKIKEGKGTDNMKMKKDLAKAEKLKEELIKEVEDMKVLKAVNEAELKSANERIKFYEEMVEKGLGEKRKDKCKNYDQGVCTFKECKYLHPTTECNQFKATRKCDKNNCLELHRNPNRSPNKEKQYDCKFWLEGHCKFGDSCHRGAHKPEKLNTKINEIKEMKMLMMQMMQQHQTQQMIPQQHQQPRQVFQQQPPPQQQEPQPWLMVNQQKQQPAQMLQQQQQNVGTNNMNEMKEMLRQMQQQLQRVGPPRQPTQMIQQQKQQVLQQQPMQVVQQQQQGGWPAQQPGGSSQGAGFGPLQQQPVLQQPGIQQPVLQQPVLQQPVLQQPVLQQPVLQQSVLQQPVLQQPGQQQIWYNGQQGEAMDQGWSMGQLHH